MVACSVYFILLWEKRNYGPYHVGGVHIRVVDNFAKVIFPFTPGIDDDDFRWQLGVQLFYGHV